MKLRDGTPYSLNTFETSTAPGVKISGLCAPADIEFSEAVFLDSPFSGRCDGLVSVVEEKCLPADEPSSLLHYVTIIWVYIGNGGDEPLDPRKRRVEENSLWKLDVSRAQRPEILTPGAVLP
jgi:hypothetical protein